MVAPVQVGVNRLHKQAVTRRQGRTKTKQKAIEHAWWLSYPCKDLANVRANDPLAVRYRRIEVEFSTPPSWSAFITPNQKRNKNMSTTLSNNKSLKQSSIPFDFPAPAARQVSLAGDFNNWDPKAMPMHKGGDGVWHLTVALKPGRHEYRFFADGTWQDDPAAQQRIANGMGSENCVKTVVA